MTPSTGAGRRRRIRLVATLVVGLLTVASCSSSSDAGTPASPSGSGSADRGASSTDATASTASPTSAVLPAKASPGCSAAQAPAVLQQPGTVDVNGTTREYLLTLPDARAGRPLPLVLDFHGLAEGMQLHAQESQLGPLGQKEGFAVVQPNGTGTPLMWDVSTDAATNKDLAFVTALLHQLATEHCIDESRVYSTGLSMGAFMTSTLACALSEHITAVAPVAGVQMGKPCQQARKVPILAFHGTQDPILYFNGGIGFDRLAGVLPGAAGGDPSTTTTTTAPPDVNGAGYPETIRSWAQKYGCKPKPTDSKEAAHVTLRTYDCPAGAAVEFTIVDGGGHTWPGSEFDKTIASIVGPTNYEIDASKQIWKFFQRFQIANPPAL